VGLSKALAEGQGVLAEIRQIVAALEEGKPSPLTETFRRLAQESAERRIILGSQQATEVALIGVKTHGYCEYVCLSDQDCGVGEEDALRAVSHVVIQVQNDHPAHSLPPEQPADSDGHVVHVTEAPRTPVIRVVAWGSQESEGRSALHSQLAAAYGSTHSGEKSLVEERPGLESCHHAGIMHQAQICIRRRLRLNEG
jgi:hypothetical protein